MLNNPNEDLDRLLLDAVDMARGAGAIVSKLFRSGHLGTHAKLNESDVVTVADGQSEAYIIERIKSLYPSHSILSEESGGQEKSDDWRWVIDPIDGTTNFSAGIPFCCVSIGIEYDGRPMVGVVYDPLTDELFTAVRGEGAFLNGSPISASSNHRLDRAVVSSGFPVDKGENPDNNLDNVSRVMPLVRGFRRLGSAAMDMCYVAAGYLDAYWEMNLHRWDVSAASLIVEEAGGVIEEYRSDRNISLIASSKALFPAIRPLIK